MVTADIADPDALAVGANSNVPEGEVKDIAVSRLKATPSLLISVEGFDPPVVNKKSPDKSAIFGAGDLCD